MQAIICEFGGYFGFSTYGLTWQEWLISIGLGFLSIPLGFVLRFIPTPKRGFCGFIIPEIDLKALFNKIRGKKEPVPVYATPTRAVEMDDIMAGPVREECVEIGTIVSDMDDYMSNK